MEDPMKQLLERAKKGDKKSRDTLVEENLGLVHFIVKRFLHRGYDAEDLFQIGCIGLMKAIDQFDSSYDVKFSTYAVPLITGEIKRFLRDDGLIKVSRSLKEHGYHIRQAEEKLYQKNLRKPTLEELADETGLSKEEIVMAVEANEEVESIYKTIYQSDGNEMYLVDQISLDGRIGDAGILIQDAEKEKILNQLFIEEIMKKLDEGEKQLIRLRFYEEKTQTEIAKKMKVNQVQICRMEKKVVKKIRNYVSGS